MKEIAKLDVVSGTELVRHVKDISTLATRVFEAEFEGQHDPAEIVREIRAALPMLPTLRSQVEARMRPSTDEEIGFHIGLMIKGIRRRKKDDPDDAAFSRILLQDVISERPSIGAVESGCMEIRKTEDFLPSIAQVLKAIAAHDSSFRSVINRIDGLPQSMEALEALAKEKDRMKRLRAEREARREADGS